MNSVKDLIGKPVTFSSDDWKLIEYLHMHMKIPIEVKNTNGYFVLRDSQLTYSKLLPGNTYRIPTDFGEE